MSYLGDIRLGDTIDFKFCTTAASTGAPTTLAGTPVISAYPGNSTTQLTAGITLTVDFDGVTGLHNVRVVASSGNGYATATNYEMVITTGTVGGTSAVGYVVGTFSIENRSAVMPTVATRTLDIASTGEAGLDINNISALTAGPLALFGIVESGTAQSATATTLVGRAAATNDIVKAGNTLFVYDSTLAYWQSVVIDSVSGDTFTIAAWPTATPAATITYYVMGTPQASSALPTPSNLTKILGTAVSTPATAGILDVNVKNINNVATTSVTTINANQGTTQPINFTGTGASALAKSDMVDIAGVAVSTSTAQLGVNAVQAGGTAWGSGAITAASIATDAITAAKIAADAIGASELAADAVTEIQSGLLTAASANATRYQKNTASQKVLFTLVDSTDHVTRKTGITVTAQRSLDGAAFGSATGTVTEVGNGVYYLSTSTADINADDVVFRFTGTACDPVELHVVTY